MTDEPTVPDFEDGDGPSSDNDVGYCKPPKSGQFKKGTSGNPKGRPKRSISSKPSETVQRVATTLVPIVEDGVKKLVTVADAPKDLEPLQALRVAFRVAANVFEQNRAFSEPRQKVIAATPALREREAGKTAAMAEALAQALVQRGVDAGLAGLCVQIGAAAFGSAMSAWLANPSTTFDAHLDKAFEQLRELSKGIRIGRSR